MLAWITAGIELLKGFFASLKLFDKWFIPSTSEKIDQDKRKIDDGIKEADQTGRPPS